MDDLPEDTPFIVDAEPFDRGGYYSQSEGGINWYDFDQERDRLVALIGGGMISAQDGIEPEYTPETGVPSDTPVRLPVHDKAHCRAAAAWAKKAFPGAIGEFLAQEIGWTAEMGFTIGHDALMSRVIEDVLKLQIHGPTE